jgi:hypothetical protein
LGFDTFSYRVFVAGPGVVKIGPGAQANIEPLFGEFQLSTNSPLVTL